MTKSEMEHHNFEYGSKMERAQAAEGQGLYRVAVDAAMLAWDNIEGMMQFSKRYGEEDLVRVDAINFILKYSPLLLDSKRLKLLEDLLRARKRITKNADEDLKAKLDEGYAHIKDNHRLWTHIEANPGARQDQLREILGGDQTYWRSVTESWDRMGLIVREPADRSFRLSLTTRMGQIVSAKCPSCGHVHEAPKAMFLEEVNCPTCGTSVSFVLLAHMPKS